MFMTVGDIGNWVFSEMVRIKMIKGVLESTREGIVINGCSPYKAVCIIGKLH